MNAAIFKAQGGRGSGRSPMFSEARTFAPVTGPTMPVLTMNHGPGGGTGVSKMLSDFLNMLPREPTGVVVIEAHAFGAGGRGVAVAGDDHALCDAVAALLPDARRGRVSGHGVSDCLQAFQGVPVVAVSLCGTEDPAAHLAMGEALAPLRAQGIVLVGSGVPSIHNFSVLFGPPRHATIAAAFKFDEWLIDALGAADKAARLAQWETAPGARVCHKAGESEHFFPTLVVAGAAGHDKGAPCFPESHAAIIGIPKDRILYPSRHFVFGG